MSAYAEPKYRFQQGAGLFTPSSLNELIDHKLREIVSRVKEWAAPVVVVGELGSIPDPHRSGIVYQLPMIDPEHPDEAILLDIKKKLLDAGPFYEGDIVKVSGSIVAYWWNGRPSIRVNVLSCEHYEPKEISRHYAENSSLALLRRLPREDRTFPSSLVSIKVIHSASSKVVGDFVGALEWVAKKVEIRPIQVSMHNPTEIAAALKGEKKNVVALVRGGGEAREFRIFEHPEVLEALYACRAFRVLGLGHTSDRIQAEFVADHAAATPTAAGEFIRKRCNENYRIEKLKGEKSELEQKLNEAQELLSSRRTFAPSLPRVIQQIALFALGFVAAWLLVGSH